MKRKKEGASLIIVIIVFMFVTTVSMAMLSMIAGNYKARVMESKRIENLYASDSGLDVAYNIMAKTFEAATKYGYYEVQALKSPDGNPKSPNDSKYKDLEADINALKVDIENLKNEEPSETRTRKMINQDIKKKNELITESKNLQQLLLNEEFKRTFKNFIKTPENDSDLGTDEEAPDKLGDSIRNHKFFDVSVSETDYNDIKFEEKTVEFGINAKKTAPTLTVKPIDEPVDISGTLETKGVSIAGGHHKNVEIEIIPEQKYENIAVTSNFYTEKFEGNNADAKKTNERTLEETFDMVIPNFKEAYYQEATVDMHQYLATQDRAITVQGNMNVTGANNFKVENGEIFVEGHKPDEQISVSNRSFKKYNGGIMVANSNNVVFNDNVITRNSFNIRNNAHVTLKKNLYGRNVYLGGEYSSSDLNGGLDKIATGSTLSVNSGDNNDESRGQIVIDNDLALKAQSSQIDVKDFYGINDKNIASKDAYGNLVDKVKSSSSIIVNSSDSSNIAINNSAYIMGTAHINTDEDIDVKNEYQTGESGAIKGNYIAYAILLKDDEKLASYDPLQLLDEPNVFTKAEHFKDYWNGEISKSHNPDDGGIIWPADSNNIWSTGAIVYKANDNMSVLGSHYMSELEAENGIVYNKQTEFAKKVYRFNEAATKKYDYDYEKLTAFSDIVNTANISVDTTYDISKQNNKGEYAIFNGDETKEVKIVKSTDGVEGIYNDGNDIVIHVTNKGTDLDPKYDLNGVIVTAGNLSIGEGITINGCIIVEGDLNINSPDVTINYDSGIIERVQAKNSGIFETVFGGWIIPPDGNNSIASSIGNLVSSYDLSYFLEKKLWKIKK